MFKGVSFCSALVVFFGLSSAVMAAQESEQFRVLRQQKKNPQVYFTLQQPVIKEVVGRALTPSQRQNLFPFQLKPQMASPGLAMASDIINIGFKLWSIVEAGKPVSSFNAQYAHALPRGADSWAMLTNWQEPMVRTFHVQYKNLYGMNVVDFTYSVVANTGGQYDNRGAYIANATVLANELSVMWGFDFKADAEVPLVMNMSTEEAPVAGMQIKVGWSVESVLSSEKRTELYFLNGLGEMKSMFESDAP